MRPRVKMGVWSVFGSLINPTRKCIVSRLVLCLGVIHNPLTVLFTYPETHQLRFIIVYPKSQNGQVSTVTYPIYFILCPYLLSGSHSSFHFIEYHLFL